MDAIAEQLVRRLESDPNDAEAYEALKAHYREAEDAPSLTNLIAGWAAYQPDPRTASQGYYEAAQVVAGAAPNHQRRLTLLRQAVERDVCFRDAVLELATLLEEHSDDHALAEFLDQHLRALEKEETDASRELMAELYVRLAELWATRFERPDVARQCYERALDLAGTHGAVIEGARALAESTQDAALLARALGAAAEAEEDPAGKVALYRSQAEAYAREPGDLNGAVQALRAAHHLEPNDVDTMRGLAEALAQRAATRTPEAAARDRRRAAELHYLIAQVVSPSEAFASLQAALRLVPHHDGSLYLLEQYAQQLDQEDQLPPFWSAYISHAADGPEVEQRRIYLARSYERAGRLDEAIACLEVVQTQGIAASMLTDLKVRRGPRSQSARASQLASQAMHANTTSIGMPTPTTGSAMNQVRPAFEQPPALDFEDVAAQTGQNAPANRSSRRKASERPIDAERLMRELRRALRNAIAAGQHAEAVERSKEIRELDPGDAEAYLLLESHYRKHADYLRLRDLLQAPMVAGTSAREHTRRLREVALLNEEKLDDIPAAIDIWRGIVELDAADPDANAQLKRLLERTEQWDQLARVLEREVLTISQPPEKVSLLGQIAVIHRDRRDDKHEALNALRELYALRPNVTTRDELCDLLLASGAYAEAVPLVWQRAQDAEGEREHLRALRQLAEIYETAVQEREAAFDVSMRILALRPKDSEALACMQRIDENAGNPARLLATLDRRAALMQRDERAGLFLDMAKIAERSLGDLDRAGEYYCKALELDSARPGVLDSLCELFVTHDRPAELVIWLERAAGLEREPARRIELRLRQARLLAGPLGNAGDASAAYRSVLEHQENVEALTYLLERAREDQDSESTAGLCARLAAATDDPGSRRALLFERAQVLVTELGRPHDAIATLRHLISDIDADYEPAIEWLAELSSNLGDTAGLAVALSRRLEKSSTQDARMALAKRLADLQEYELTDREQALLALNAWAKADPKDPAPQRRRRPLLEESGRFADLVACCDALAALEMDQEASDDATLTAAQVAFAQLRQFDAAWQRLMPLLDRGHPKAMQLLLTIARQTNRCEDLATLCIRAAQDAPSLELQGELWGHAARIFREELGDPQKAFEAALRLLATDLKSRDALTRVEEAAAQADLWPRLNPVYDRLLKAAENDAERIELLVRHADLLERGARDFSEALDCVLQASALAPSDETLIARAERLAANCGRGPELMRLCEQQAQRAEQAQQASVQVEWLLRAARFAISTSEDRTVTSRLLETALAATQADVSLWEQCIAFAQQLDARADTGEPHAALRALITAHRRVAERVSPAVGATLILRASRLLDDRLSDERAAFDLVRAGSAALPLDETLYDNLLQRAETAGRLDALDAHLSRGVDEALDPRTAACLLARRARLLEGPLGRPDDAANVYAKLLQLRPDDLQATSKLRDSLRRAKRFQDLLVVIHKQTQRAKSTDEKVELLKESAHVWELDLKNRWEAVDAWRKVLEIEVRDSEAIRALTRLDRRSLPPALGGLTESGPYPTSQALPLPLSIDLPSEPVAAAMSSVRSEQTVPENKPSAPDNTDDAAKISSDVPPNLDIVAVDDTASDAPAVTATASAGQRRSSAPPAPPAAALRKTGRGRSAAPAGPVSASGLPTPPVAEQERPARTSAPPRKG